jgi:hypothetical protein
MLDRCVALQACVQATAMVNFSVRGEATIAALGGGETHPRGGGVYKAAAVVGVPCTGWAGAGCVRLTAAGSHLHPHSTCTGTPKHTCVCICTRSGLNEAGCYAEQRYASPPSKQATAHLSPSPDEPRHCLQPTASPLLILRSSCLPSTGHSKRHADPCLMWWVCRRCMSHSLGTTSP